MDRISYFCFESQGSLSRSNIFLKPSFSEQPLKNMPQLGQKMKTNCKPHIQGSLKAMDPQA